MTDLYLVTGGAGFIGSATAQMLVNRGAKVRILDNLSTGKRWMVPEGAKLIVGDVTQYRHCAAAVEGAQYVIHLAAIASVPRSLDDPIASHEANATGTLNMLEASERAGVRRFVYASSSSVYGDDPERLPVTESMASWPISPYAIGKLAGEQYCRAYHLFYGLDTVALRYFNVYGPRQDPSSQYAAVVPKFIDALLDGRPLTVYGDGWQTRDFTYVDNVAEANLLACHAPDAVGRVFNIAGGERHSLIELIGTLEDVTELEANIEYTDPRPGDVPHSWANIDWAKRCMGYDPQVNFAEGLTRTVAWFRGEL